MEQFVHEAPRELVQLEHWGDVPQHQLVQSDTHVLVIWRGERRVRSAVIAGAHYVAWIVISLVVLGVVKLFAGG